MKKTTSLLWFVLIVAMLVVGAVLALQAKQAIRNSNLSALANLSVIDWATIVGVENSPRTDDPTLYDITLVAKNGEKMFFTTTSNLYADAAHWYQLQNGNLYVLKRAGYGGASDADWSDELWKIDGNKQETKLAAGKGIDYLVAPNDNTVALLQDQQITLIDLVRKTDRVLAANQVSLSNDALTVQFLTWSSDSFSLWGYAWHSTSPNFFRLTAPGWTIERYGVPELPFGRDFALNPNTGLLAYSAYPLFLDATDDEQFQSSGTEVVLWQYNLLTQKRESLAKSAATMFRPTWKDDVTVSYDDPDNNGNAPTAAITLDEHILAESQYRSDASEQYKLYSACPNRQTAFESLLKRANTDRKLLRLNGVLPVVMTPNTGSIDTDTFLAYSAEPNAYCGAGITAPLYATADHLFWAQGNCSGATADEHCLKAEEAIKTFSLTRQVPLHPDPFTFSVPAGWTMRRGYGAVNALAGGGPMKSAGFSVEGKDQFSSPNVSILWYHFNPHASLADIVNLRFPNNADGTIVKRDANAMIGGRQAHFLAVDGSTTPQPYDQASFWFVRMDTNTIAEINASYPTRKIFDAENASVQQLLNSLNIFSPA